VSGVDAVIHTARLSDGSRKIVAISEVLPLENGEYRLKELQRWHTDSISEGGTVVGGFEMLGTPTFAPMAKIYGVEL
jgi:pilus assembly protein CpaF